MRNRSLSLVPLVLMMLAACKPVQDRGAFVRDVFSDFRYVGEYPAGQSFPASITPASKPFPTKFAAQRLYVFQPIGEVNAIELATNILPAGLRKAGVEVTGAPRNQGDFATPSLGGPVWDIGFKQGLYIGRIYNRLNRLLYEERINLPAGSNDDIILIFEN